MAPERYLELMALDKKAAGGRMRFILLERIGHAVLRADVDERLVRETLAAGTAQASAAAAR
jgi:3-dehydroquinate synthase